MEFNQILFRISCISPVNFYQIPFLFLPLLVVMAASSEGRSLEKRQTQSGDRGSLHQSARLGSIFCQLETRTQKVGEKFAKLHVGRQLRRPCKLVRISIFQLAQDVQLESS